MVRGPYRTDVTTLKFRKFEKKKSKKDLFFWPFCVAPFLESGILVFSGARSNRSKQGSLNALLEERET